MFGNAWYHWAIGAAIVAACAVAVVVTAGGVVAGAAAVSAVGGGMSASTAASTVAASAFLGSATVYGAAAMYAEYDSDSIQEFSDHGDWGTVVSTAGGAIVSGGVAYAYTYTRPVNVAPVGSPFVKGQKVNSTQIGVDPYTLIINSTIHPDKLKAARNKILNEGMYGIIEVYSDGTVYNGNHRVTIAKELNIAVDTIVVFN